MSRWLNDLGVAFENMWHVLITPREVQHDELLAAEFCTKLRAMGEDPERVLHSLAMLAAAGVTEEQARVFMWIAASRKITREDINQLEDCGVAIRLFERPS